MKKTVMVGLISLFILASCDFFNANQESDNSTSSSTVDLVPSFGSSTASRVIIPEDTTNAEAVATLFTPLLYNFEENSGEVGVGDTFIESNAVLGDVTFTISEAGGNLIFEGKNSNDTLWVDIEYDPDNNTFDYTQTFTIDDEHNVLKSGEHTRVTAQISYSDVSINEEDLSFNSYGHVVALMTLADLNSTMMQISEESEIYYGTLEDGVTGTGISIYKMYQKEGDNFDIFPASDDAPNDIEEFEDLQQMSDYFDDVTIEGFTEGLTSDVFGQIYKNDGSSIEMVYDLQTDDSTENDESPEYFLSQYPSTWGENSVRKIDED